ncbi:MAG TPA: glycerophosphodiester phosphodiesterase family protein [Limnochordia bacterium]|nr:glycerophosphodiester phosphodiesterase family protein [Limnochordia bacterium]
MGMAFTAAAAVLVLGLVGLAVALIKPNRRRVDQPPTRWYAHRGLHGPGIPENSLLAFQKAKEKGFGVELDVQMTKDGRLVVFHDATLKRMCGAKGIVSQLTYDELRQYRLTGSEQKIPLFREVLDLLEDLPVICEIKPHNGNSNPALCELVCEEIRDYKGEVWIESFSPLIVRWFKVHRPDLIRGQLSMDFVARREGLKFHQAFLMKHLLVNILGRPDFVAYCHKDRAWGFSLCRKLFRPLCLAWTVNDPALFEQLVCKFDGFIFENRLLDAEE